MFVCAHAFHGALVEVRRQLSGVCGSWRWRSDLRHGDKNIYRLSHLIGFQNVITRKSEKLALKLIRLSKTVTSTHFLPWWISFRFPIVNNTVGLDSSSSFYHSNYTWVGMSGGSQPYVTPAPGALTPSLVLCGHPHACVHTSHPQHIHIYMQLKIKKHSYLKWGLTRKSKALQWIIILTWGVKWSFLENAL